MRFKPLLSACSILIATVMTLPATAAYPDRALSIIVPFSAGGATDALSRVIGEGLSKELGQPVVVENRPGAGGNIGATAAARAKPDGYTLFMATSTHATNATLYKNLAYDLRKDLTPVSLVAYIPNALVVNKDFKAKTLKDLVSLVQKGGDPINYGSAGSGSSQHLSAAMFNHLAKGQMTHVPYKGGAPAVQDLLAGRIQVIFSPLVEVLPYIESGRLMALGLTSLKRSPRLPDVPAIAEALPGYETVLWDGLLAPAGTPPEIIDHLNKAVKKVLEQPKVKDILLSQGTVPMSDTPAEFAKFIDSEIDRQANLVKISGAKIN